MKYLVKPIILSGGSGMRLWPVSRISYPKQLINFNDDETMLQATLKRLNGINNIDDAVIMTSDECRFIVAEQLRQIGKEDFNMIVEPAIRNTAPALTAAVIKLLASGNKDYICLVMPADHYVKDVVSFKKILRQGIELASNGYIITFGITPNAPEIGYGYIKKGDPYNKTCCHNLKESSSAAFIEHFVEKPNLKVAKKFLDSGNYYWNSGIFVFKASKIFEELKKFVPNIFKACELSVKNGIEKNGFFYLDKNDFSQCSNSSIDRAVLERTSNGVVIPMDVGWRDLGSWKSLWQHEEKNKEGNVLKGNVVVHDVKNSYIFSESRLVTALGIINHVIVETEDAVLVSSLKQSQDLKYITKRLKKNFNKEIFQHKKKQFSWGNIERLLISDVLIINYISVKSENFFCINEYFKLNSYWIVVSGQGIIKNNDLSFPTSKKKFFFLDKKSKYFFCNSKQKLVALELVGLS